MDWDKLRIFHAVADAGSFTHAGEALNLHQSAVSRHIAGLEESLRVPLFHRHPRGLRLTEQGEMLYRTAHDVFTKLAMAEQLLRDHKEKPSGELRVTTTVAFGSTWLAPRMAEFIRLYPEIDVDLMLEDRDIDLGQGKADVAIRMRAPVQSDLIQRRLFTVHYHIYCSPDYIEHNGLPRTVADLDQHAIIIYGEGVPATLRNLNWLATIGRANNMPRTPRMKVNNVYGVLLACEAGVGLAALPDYLARGNQRLTRVALDVEDPSFDTYFVFPEELRESKRVGVFRDYLLRQSRDWTF